MKKLVTLCFLICSVLVAYPQNFGNLTGSLTGSSVTTAAANAAKQLVSMNSGNSNSNASLSQLQLLGLDPNAVQKYIKSKSDASAAGATDISPLQDMLQTVLEMRMRQDSMQAQMDSLYRYNQPNNQVKPNEIFGHDFFGTGRLALFSKSSDSKAPDSYILDVGDEISVAVWG